MTKRMERNYGIDLLRFVSMLMVVVCHIIGETGLLEHCKQGTSTYKMLWALRACFICSVNCYAMISGYVGISSKHKYSNLLNMWLRIVFWQIVILLAAMGISPSMIDRNMVLSAFFPVFKHSYWFVSCYFGLFLFMPILSCAVHTLEKKELQIILVAMFLIFSVGSLLFDTDAFELKSGYSVLWLACLYTGGGYIGKYHPFSRISKKMWGLVYVGSAGLTYIFLYCTWNVPEINPLYHQGGLFCRFTSPMIIMEAFALLMLFSQIKVSGAVKNLLHKFTPSVFYVYIIHMNPLVKKIFLKDSLISWCGYSSIKCLLLVLGLSIALFISCLLLDSAVRFLLMKIKNIKIMGA